VEWAKQMYLMSKDWKERCGGDIVRMLLMPEIIAACYFEADCGQYFEVVMHWHSQPGLLSKCPGFCMLELPSFFLDFEAPFWLHAMQQPEVRFKKTFDAIAVIPDEDERFLKRRQVLEGIKAGYTKLIHTSKSLLSPPNIFILLDDSNRGPSLMRAIVGIMNHGGMNIGNGWGTYDPSVEMEKYFYDLLAVYGEDVVRGFGQLGLMRGCVRPDLQRLSNETTGSRSGHDLLHFKSEYPVIYAALSAAYALYPSASCIAEQEHGGLRAGLQDGVAMQRTDCERQYIMNEVHAERHERREEFLHRHNGEEVAKKKQSAPHDKEKWQQQMEAKQLLESMERYSEERIALLPEELRNDIAIGRLTKRGIQVKDKKVKEHRNELEDQKAARHKKTLPSDEEWMKRASEAKIENDQTWVDQKTLQRKADLYKLASKGYWDRLLVKDGFHNEFEQVLPFGWNASFKTQTKAKLKPIIKAHLDIVYSIAKTKENTISTVDVSHLDHDNILELFVQVDSSPYLKRKKERERKRHEATASLMKLGGTNIAEKYKGMGS